MRMHWEIKSLDEIATVKGGKRVPKGYKFETIPTLHPYITVADFTENGTVYTKNLKYISNEVYEQIKNYTISSQDIYISIAGTIGKTGSVPKSLDGANLTENACKLVLHKGIDKKFVYYFTKTDNFVQQTGINTRVAAQPKLALERLKTITLPIPTLSEQKQIVAILDETLEGIDRAIANAEKNLANARELFESYLNTIFTQKGNRWEWVSLSEITTDITDGDHQPPPKSQSGIPFITISNINKQNRKVDFSNTFKVSPEYFEKLKSNRKPRKGDLLYTVTGSYGIPVIVDYNINFCFQRHIGLIRPNAETNSKCLYYILLSRYLLNQADECATGTAQKTVSLSGLRRFSVPKIPREEQEVIVVDLDFLAEKICRLETIYLQKLAALNELKQSILQKVFTGELTADIANQITKAAKEGIAA